MLWQSKTGTAHYMSGSAEEAEELTATEAENDQSVYELQPEEPAVTTGDENTEEPTDVIEAPSADPDCTVSIFSLAVSLLASTANAEMETLQIIANAIQTERTFLHRSGK